MKTVYKLFHATVLTLCSAIMLSSCDSFLDTKPYDFTAPETFYSKADNWQVKSMVTTIIRETNMYGVHGRLFTKESTMPTFFLRMLIKPTWMKV